MTTTTTMFSQIITSMYHKMSLVLLLTTAMRLMETIEEILLIALHMFILFPSTHRHSSIIVGLFYLKTKV